MLIKYRFNYLMDIDLIMDIDHTCIEGFWLFSLFIGQKILRNTHNLNFILLNLVGPVLTFLNKNIGEKDRNELCSEQ